VPDTYLSSDLFMPLLAADFFVRVGVLGQVGRFRASDGQRYSRGARVVCRTRRGLETGEILSAASLDARAETRDGSILRRCTVEDDLLLARLEQNRREAYNACVELLAERDLTAVLVDVEHLFDGRSLYFYFLGPVSPAVDAITQELAEAYDAEVQFRTFSDAVQQGCGPDCGTENAAGCGSLCAGCVIGSACHS
jgi:cell fate regulator YaaT (PSP1 superfamily)